VVVWLHRSSLSLHDSVYGSSRSVPEYLRRHLIDAVERDIKRISPGPQVALFSIAAVIRGDRQAATRRYIQTVSEVTKRQEFVAELVAEVLAIVVGLVMALGLGWWEFGPLLVLFGIGGFVVTCVRHRRPHADADAA
jgi:hypothetical protein